MSETRTAPTTQTQVPTQAPAPEQELTPEQRELLDAMNRLIISTQELSYAVALISNELVEKHPELKELIEAAKNVVRASYDFYKIVKRRARR